MKHEINVKVYTNHSQTELGIMEAETSCQKLYFDHLVTLSVISNGEQSSFEFFSHQIVKVIF